MNELIGYIVHLILIAGIIFLTWFLITSYNEKEIRAFKRTIPVLFVFILLLLLTHFQLFSIGIQWGISMLFTAGIILVFIPEKRKQIIFNVPDKRTDERDTMFSRMELIPGTNRFKEYYSRNKDKKAGDDDFRKDPGLLGKNSTFYHSHYFEAAEATFSIVNLLHPEVENPPSDEKVDQRDDIETSRFVKNWAIKLGAVSAGYTEVKPYHYYSNRGRGNAYGDEVVINHKYAFAFTVEMNHESMRYAPRGPVILESASQYLNAGTIAVQVAAFLRRKGYEARAHIDANYELICPVVAMDAGLGNIGRIGLLMTPELGPRVRIGVVTTNMVPELKSTMPDDSVIRFCDICKKCAENCPSNAISRMNGTNGQKKEPWKTDSEKCFSYWCKTGTDCGKCVAVCPYSHPDNSIHNIVRAAIKRNKLNRRAALMLDDYFYGRRPRSYILP